MGLPALKLNERFTYQEYLTWPEGERWELIYGVAYDMSPAPSPQHQSIVVEFVTIIHNFLRGSPCQVYVAPFDVRLPEKDEADEEIETVVQPDIAIICDAAKIDQRGCKGAPDLIIEVLSPFTVKKDKQQKLRLYEAHGVKEYWLVYPLDQFVEVLILNEQGVYSRPIVYNRDERISVGLFPGLEIDLAVVFGVEKPKDSGAKPSPKVV
jgi:Uma2 family endonuclease